jgi:hypothetical protein
MKPGRNTGEQGRNAGANQRGPFRAELLCLLRTFWPPRTWIDLSEEIQFLSLCGMNSIPHMRSAW